MTDAAGAGARSGRDDVSRSEHPAEFGAAYWEDRYRTGEGGDRHGSSPSLVDEASDLPPGRALDAGCGTGADAVWLAARGWHVTAVDVSATALDRAREHARGAGQETAERIDWVHADLTTWTPGERRFDFVASHYVHVPGPPEELFRRLASWVAPAGTLLVVGHDHAHDPGHDHDGAPAPGHRPGPGDGHRPAAGSGVTAGQVTDGLGQDEWDVLVAGPRTHTVGRPGAADPVALHDTVVRARRRGVQGS